MTDVKKILITTESHEVFIVRVSDKSDVRGFCSDCEHEVELLTLDQTVNRTGKTARELFRQIEAGEIHSIETASGHLLVCLDSLGNYFQGETK